jgi:hypothetical protein
MKAETVTIISLAEVQEPSPEAKLKVHPGRLG